ncbi:hypothetical protein [Amaricoccus macauensis]|uniref:hypothetical protein n=1 Tax=Amaricoccus macauensis TaxID=57001 RepID=UPI003C7A7764
MNTSDLTSTPRPNPSDQQISQLSAARSLAFDLASLRSEVKTHFGRFVKLEGDALVKAIAAEIGPIAAKDVRLQLEKLVRAGEWSPNWARSVELLSDRLAGYARDQKNPVIECDLEVFANNAFTFVFQSETIWRLEAALGLSGHGTGPIPVYSPVPRKR